MPMPMTTKHWSDRADRDLFFAILSVKNIGVISGAEWTVVGNDMRTLGYGFTNEGCRQHFQGLRRSISSKKKRDDGGGEAGDGVAAAPGPSAVGAVGAVGATGSNAVGLAKAVGTDPTRNPITRRPGPGRGRPRKQKQGGPETEGQEEGGKEEGHTDGLSAELRAVANGLRPLLPAGASSSGNGSGSQVQQQGQKRRRPSQVAEPVQPVQPAQSLRHTPDPPPAPVGVSSSAVSVSFGSLGDSHDDDTEEEHDNDDDDDDDDDENRNKRQRLGGTASAPVAAYGAHLAPQPPLRQLEDDPVLAALATHSNNAFPTK